MKIATYNIASGGFKDYQNKSPKPERLDLLIQAIKQSASIILGDFNSIIPEEVKEVCQKNTDFLENNPEFIKQPGYESYFEPVFKSLIRPQVLPWLTKQGYQEAALPFYQPTAMTLLHSTGLPLAFRLDHIFYSQQLKADNFQIFTSPLFHQASDHLPIAINISDLRI